VSQASANIIGLGLIGGSIAAALSARGWQVHGSDRDPAVCARASEMGLIVDSTPDPAATISFVTVPVTAVPSVVREVLASTRGVVTDVGSVKASVCSAVSDPRFVGGHPMAGSELHGLDGSDPELFRGATWVLTPTATTSDDTFRVTAETVKALGAEVMVLAPERHDHLVALVSHLPHLTAATLMGLAARESEEHLAVLRLAAGGFRDMTRVASGSAAIWVDICRENRDAIIAALDEMVEGLSRMRTIVSEGRTDDLLERLQRAREARANLPGRIAHLDQVVEVRVPISDRSGSAVEIFQIAAELGVNIANFEVSHSVEGEAGVLVLLVETQSRDLFKGGLMARGFRPVVVTLS
jgi:prephenate dehydrogenase